MKKQKGFSLVELLVVLAIVGILMGLAVAGIRIVQQVNRDTQRRALVKDIQLALESYQERFNRYPTGTGGINVTAGTDHVTIKTMSGSTAFETIESKINFDISQMSTKPTTGGEEPESGNFSYYYEGGAKGYELYILLERTPDGYDAGNE